MATQISENRTALYLAITKPTKADSSYFHNVTVTHKTGNAA